MVVFLLESYLIIFKNPIRHCFYSENKNTRLTIKKDSYCAAYCSCKTYLTKVLGIDFKSAVLDLYQQKFSVNK